MNLLSQLICTTSASNLGISIPFFQKYQQQYSVTKIFMDHSVGKAVWVSLCEYTMPLSYFPVYLYIINVMSIDIMFLLLIYAYIVYTTVYLFSLVPFSLKSLNRHSQITKTAISAHLYHFPGVFFSYYIVH